MSLTKAQRRVVGEIEDLLRISNSDWRAVEERHVPEARLGQLERIKLDLLRMRVISDYVFADELLTVIIVAYYFPVKDFPKRWTNPKMRSFLHFTMEDIYLLRKAALVKEIPPRDRRFPFDKKIFNETLPALNGLRNAMAHSFNPERKREYRSHRKVIWKGKHQHHPRAGAIRRRYIQTSRPSLPAGFRQDPCELEVGP